MPLELLLAALAISLDNLAAALALGTRIARGSWHRVALVFVLFGCLAPAVGVLLGRTVSAVAAQWAATVGVAALAGLGLYTLVRALRRKKTGREPSSKPSVPSLLLLGATLSGDNLVVGFGLGVRGAEPLLIAVLAAAAILMSTYVGLAAGRHGLQRWGRWAEGGAGLVLIAIAAAMLIGAL